MDIPQTRISSSPYHGLNRNEIDRICEKLESNNQIGLVRHRYAKNRFVPLRKTELFNKLVTLYHGVFRAYWPCFKHVTCIGSEIPPGFIDKILYVATCYISGWFWDLQVTLRKCVQKLPGMAFNTHFRDEVHHISNEYDPFLQHLNSIIRPTHIQMTPENALYIPIIAETLNLNDSGNLIGNVFDIPGFHVDKNVTRYIILVMRQRGNGNPFCTEQLSTDNHGRPGWLFDYHQGYAYSWFPMENNYSLVDLIAPQILGIPFTPRLAPRDVDEWQFFPGGVLPASLNPKDYKRFSPRNFFGSIEYTTLEHERYTFPLEYTPRTAHARTGSKRAAIDMSSTSQNEVITSSAAQQQQPEPISVYRYRLVDWTYHHQVTTCVDQQARDDAFHSFIFKSCCHP